jgi:hypothetical protein
MLGVSVDVLVGRVGRGEEGRKLTVVDAGCRPEVGEGVGVGVGVGVGNGSGCSSDEKREEREKGEDTQQHSSLLCYPLFTVSVKSQDSERPVSRPGLLYAARRQIAVV